MGRAGGAPLATPVAVVSFAPLARAARLLTRGMMVVGAGRVTSMDTVRLCVSVCGGSIVRRELSLRGSGDRRRAQGASHGNFAPKKSFFGFVLLSTTASRFVEEKVWTQSPP